MDVDCRGCKALDELEAKFEEFKKTTEAHLSKLDTQFAVINTKLSAIIWLVGAVGTALVGVLVKLVFGG